MIGPTQQLSVGSLLVGFFPVKLPVDAKTYHGARLTASLDNTVPIYFSNKPVVSWQGEHEGYALHPGQSIDLEVEELGKLYAISTDIMQVLQWAMI